MEYMDKMKLQIDTDSVRIHYIYGNESKTSFSFEKALAVLLIEGKVFINEHWWKSSKKKNKFHIIEENSWPEDACETIYLGVNCNDVFVWGCADSEEMFYEDIEDVFDHFMKDRDWGTEIWCIKKRKMLPQRPVYESIMSKGIWDLKEISKEWETNENNQ